MRYEFRCLTHPDQVEVVFRPMKEQEEWTHGQCPKCGRPLELNMNGSGHQFQLTYGRLTGLYDYDYGKKATWDLTAPGKMQYCKKEGIIRDPFDYGPPPVTNDHLVPEI